MSNLIRPVRCRSREDLVVRESLSSGVKSIEAVLTAHPQRSRSVFDQRLHEHATQAIGLGRIILEQPEVVSVVAVDSVLSTEPHESLVVLNNLCYAVLGQTFDARESQESNVIAVDDGYSDRIRTDPCLRCTSVRIRDAVG